MNEAIELSVLILMGASLVVLILEAIEKKSPADQMNEKPHIKLFAQTALAAVLFYCLFSFNLQQLIYKNSDAYLNGISVIFLTINTWITIFLSKYTLPKSQNGEVYFLLLATLAISIANIHADTLAIKLICSNGWLILLAALVIKTTQGGKKAEIGLKLSFTVLIFMLFFMVALYSLAFSQSQNLISKITINTTAFSLDIVGISFFFIAGLCLCGIPPFHFGHIDCSDGGNSSIAFLLLSNSIIQGSSHIFKAKSILMQSNLNVGDFKTVISLILAAGLLILWLRALDQRSIRRTITYVAATTGPLFCLALLFGKSSELPDSAYVLSLFSFLTLSLFTLYGSLAFMNPINLPQQTWEDMAGFGRKNILQTLCFLIATASIGGLPGTLGYFVKLSLIGPMQENLIFESIIFLSVAMGAACALRIFVFAFSKQSHFAESAIKNSSPPMILMLTSTILIALGFFPFVR